MTCPRCIRGQVIIDTREDDAVCLQCGYREPEAIPEEIKALVGVSKEHQRGAIHNRKEPR